MIKQTIYIDSIGWLVHAYFHKTRYDVDEIMERLWDLQCNSEIAQKAFNNLISDSLDMGLCYSNYHTKESVLVVGRASSADEFFNSIVHELSHLQGHICDVIGLDPKGEEIAYYMGDLSRDIYPSISHLLCDCCRNKDY
jgi:hypothetical protein